MVFIKKRYVLVGALAILFSGFTDGTGPILLDNVQCIGNEKSLISCTANKIGVHNCAHDEGAGAICMSMGKFSFNSAEVIGRKCIKFSD